MPPGDQPLPRPPATAAPILSEAGRRRWLLREGTQPQHDAAEAALERLGFFRSRPGYAAFLRCSWRFHAGFEPAAEAAGVAALLDDWPIRRKLPRIEADCRAFGIEPGGAVAMTLAGCPALLGALYVTEGATLGGAVLARRARTLGVEERALGFLDAYGQARGQRWRSFLAVLEAVPLAAVEELALVEAARTAFARYLAVMTEA